MSAVTISPDFQVTIPEEARERLALQPGQQLEVLCYGNQITLVPVVPMERMRGCAPGIGTDVPRDKDRV